MKSSLRPKARPLSKKEKERKERDAMIKGMRQKAGMMHGLDEYGRGKAASQGRLADPKLSDQMLGAVREGKAEKREPSLFDLLGDEESTDMKYGGKVKKMKKGGKVKKMKKGGKMPDLTGDGKVTQADVLKGRGVCKKGGKVRGYGLARGGKACKMR